MYQTILFDLDGTLTDPGEGITNSVIHALKKYGIEVPDKTELYKFIGPPLHESFQVFYGFSEEKAEEAVKYYREYYSKTGIFENKVYDGIEETLKILKDSGKKLVVATSKPEIFAKQILEHFHLAEYFSFVAGANLDGTRTRKDEVISYALNSCQIGEYSDVIMVGDREHDILGAARFGIDSIGVLYGYGNEKELKDAGATYLAEHPRDICSRIVSVTGKDESMKVEERFLKYVSYWTTSEYGKDVTPSTDRQFALADELEKEMRELGLSKVKRDEHCYVYGLLPATEGFEDKRPMGFIAHMDTAQSFSGKDVKPQIIPDYDGKDIVLPGNGDVIKVSDFPHLSSLKGRTLITTDGTTLLGADDKAGIASILTAVEEMMKEKIPHGDIWIGFTPDEEIGAGADLFDLDYFQADYAYTVDGDYEGEMSYENFNASSAHFVIKGVNVHPGSAKNIMVNAASIACEIHSMLPDQETPEHTEGREGFYHLEEMHGDVNEAHLDYIVRDHDSEIYEKRQQVLREIETKMNEKYGAGTVSLSLNESYRNMLEVMEKNFFVVEKAKEAIEAAGIKPSSLPIRGGTDGGRLSFMGLPCPNLGTGGYAFHGPKEHVTVEGMEAVVKVIKGIMKHPVEKE